MSWYRSLYAMLERQLLAVDWLLNLSLVLVILISSYLLFFGKSQTAKAAWSVYLWMP